jgi:hypothetical protein
VTRLPTFDDMRADAYALLGDVQDVLRTDWRPGTGPTLHQADATFEAQRHIALAKAALNKAARS